MERSLKRKEMICCLNPDCDHPLNPESNKYCQHCGTPLKSRLRNRYKITQPIGRGGFGKTYLAQDTDKLNELCVVKQLAFTNNRSHIVEKAKQLFKREAEQLQHLGSHPQIPSLLAYFEEDNYLYLVQEFVKGQNLLQKLDEQGEFTEAQIIELLKDLLPILEFIHSNNVIHRDIKPGNIMWRSDDSKYVLIDFGVSKVLNPSSIAHTGTTLGSQGYAPPEQIIQGKATPASDLYSLGGSCFHLLTGINPVSLLLEGGSTWVEKWQNHVKTPLNPKLVSILNKLLKNDIKKRYQKAPEVLKDLHNLEESSDISGWSTISNWSTIAVTNKWNFNPKSLLAGNLRLIYVGFALAIGLGVGIYATYKISTQILPESEVPRSQSPNNENKQPLSPKISNVNLETTISSNQGKRLGEVWSLAISPDGKILASGNDRNTVSIYNLKSQELLKTLNGHKNVIRSLVFSPDGKTLISGDGDGKIEIWDWQTETTKAEIAGHSGSIWSLAISPDGKTLVSSSEDRLVKFWNLETGQLIRTLPKFSAPIFSVVFTPNGEKLAIGSREEIKIWDIQIEAFVRSIEKHQEAVRALAISPDGKYLVSGSWDTTVKVWELKTGKLIHTLQGHENRVVSVGITRDSQKIVSGSVDNTIDVWNIDDGSLISSLEAHSNWVLALAPSLAEDLFVSGSKDEKIKIWRYSQETDN